jgi:hypothetical protein
MISDLPSQFRGKARINSLIYALSRQLNEVKTFYEQIRDQTALKTAEGKQLDGVGEIAVLSRDEAAKLAMKSAEFTQMTDWLYRLYLIQKIMANTSICTYQEIYSALVILWGKTPIWYAEDPDQPATILFTVPALPSYDNIAGFLGVWEIRPAGVELNFAATAQEGIVINAGLSRSAFIVTHIKTGTKPRWAIILNIDGIVVDENLSKQMFTVKSEQTSESLYSGTNPMRIVYLDIDGVAVHENFSKIAYVETHYRSGTKPNEAVVIEIRGMEIDEAGIVTPYALAHDQTSEDLHSGAKENLYVVDQKNAVVKETLSQEKYGMEFDRTGTKPGELISVGIQGITINEQGQTANYTVKSPQTSENLHAGTEPSKIMITDLRAASIYEILDKEVFDVEYERSGTEPQETLPFDTDSAGIKTSLTPAPYSVKYRKCGTRATKS